MIHFTEDGTIREPFIIRVLTGEAKLEDVNDEVDAWHKTGPKPGDEPNPYESPDPLNEWLGLTKAEYARFVKSEAALRDIVAERKAMNDARRRTYDDDPINPDMGEGRYQDTLRRFRARVAEGLPLDLDDSDFPGDKYTSASWGLCCDNDLKAYPDLNDHTFPARIAGDMKGRHELMLSPRDPPEGATCPMDRGLQKPDACGGKLVFEFADLEGFYPEYDYTEAGREGVGVRCPDCKDLTEYPNASGALIAEVWARKRATK